MTDAPSNALSLYPGWDTFQDLLVKTIAPLTADQLDLRSAPRLRSVSENCRHIIGARGRWCHEILEIGGDESAGYGRWDEPDMPPRTAAALATALQDSWRILRDALAAWGNADMDHSSPNPEPEPGQPDILTRRWVIWHLIEHDIFHGGEISQILGAHGLTGLDL
ncbi:MAG TPA: DinB family protein [Ktedonobacterales bacterium]